MAFCEQCGSKLEPNMKFCQSCGAKVAAAAAPATSSAVTGSYGTPASAGAFSEPVPVELSSGASGSFGAAASTGFSEPIMGAGDCAPAGTYGAPAQDLGGRVEAEAPQAPTPAPAPAPQPAPVVPEPTPEPEPVIETIPEPVVEFIPDPEPVVIPTPAPAPTPQPAPQPVNQGQYTAPTPQPTTANQGQYTAPTPPPAKPPKREKPAKSGGGKKGLKILLIIIAIIVALIVIASLVVRAAAKKALDSITEDQWEEAFEDLEDTYNEDIQEQLDELQDTLEEAQEAAEAAGEDLEDTITTEDIIPAGYDLSFWEGEWYGWWIIDSASGEYEELEGAYYDTCAIITSNGDGTGVIDMWDTEGSYDALMASADITFRAGTAPEGAFVSESGQFYDNTIEHADWLVYSDIVDATYDMNYDHMISIEGWYTNPENDDDEIRYIIYLRPWGMTWTDIEEETPDNLPDYYYDWYLPLIEAGESMPHTIGE